MELAAGISVSPRDVAARVDSTIVDSDSDGEIDRSEFALPEQKDMVFTVGARVSPHDLPARRGLPCMGCESVWDINQTKFAFTQQKATRAKVAWRGRAITSHDVAPRVNP